MAALEVLEAAVAEVEQLDLSLKKFFPLLKFPKFIFFRKLSLNLSDRNLKIFGKLA